MISEFDKEYLPVWCEGCNQQGYIFPPDPDGSYFVTCKTCGWETSQVWCPKCQMGGDFVRTIRKHPSSWTCPNCKTKYSLPDGFYENSINLFMQEELPFVIQERIEKGIQASRPFSRQNFWHTVRTMVVLLLGIVALFAVGLLPMVLVLTPLPWTIPGFIATLLVFVVWWWIIGRVLKNVRERFAKRSS